MLKPFQIRDLHRSSSQDSLAASQSLDHAVVEDRSPLESHHQGIVQLSATEYDEITTNHPRARLTYVDDDDDELITVCLLIQTYLSTMLIVNCRWDHLSSFPSV